MYIPEEFIPADGPPTGQRALWRRHIVAGLAAAALITVIALVSINTGAGAAPQLTRHGDWGYTSQSASQISYVTVNIYDASNNRISTQRENIAPYCAKGDSTQPGAQCYVPSLNDGTYKVEAIAFGTDGSRTTVSHNVTVGDGTSSPTNPPAPTPTTTTSSGGSSSGGSSSSGGTSSSPSGALPTQLSRLGDWGYLAGDSSKVSFVTMNVYDGNNNRVSTRQENIAPYCAYGDSGAGATSCTVPSLSNGTYRVEAIARFTNGTSATWLHSVTIGSSSSGGTAPSSAPAVVPTPVVSNSPGLIPANAVLIAVGESWQAKVNANPNGTTFRVQAGTHRRQEVLAKPDQSFICETSRACVMDGEFVTAYAFRGSAANLRVSGMKITRYRTPTQRGVIDGCLNGTPTGWLIQDNEITWNTAGAIYLGPSGRFLNNEVTYNGQIGLKACGSNGLIEGNEVAYNNSFCPSGTAISNPGGVMGCVDYGWEGGGSKFVKTNGLMIRNNHVYGNCGPGLWADIDNINITWQGNNVHNNSASGIFHEIGYKGVIKGNDVRNNGLTITVPHPTNGSSRTCQGGGGSWGGAEITVNNSSNTEVTDNYVDAASGRKGIMVVQQNRNGYMATGNWFHDNRGPDGGCTWAFADWQSSVFFANNNFGVRC